MAASSKTIRAQTRHQASSQSQAPVEGASATVAALKPISTSPVVRVRTDVPASLRHDMIEHSAYFRAQERGFTPGFELDDWIAAEAEVDSIIRERYR